jgi:hypothetical protein
MTDFVKRVFDVKFTCQHEEDKFLADFAMELIRVHTDCVVHELISVQKHMIKLKNTHTGLFYFVYIYKVIDDTSDGQYGYKELSFEFNMLLTKRLNITLSNFYNYYSKRYDVGCFSELRSKVVFSNNTQSLHFRFIGVDDHCTKFIIEDDKVCQYNYYDAKLLSTQVLTFVEFEILFKCSILHEHANNLLLEYIPEFFGPQQKMPSDDALISTLTLIDILMFTQGLAGYEYLI